jgi:tripartite-type tricarboxylate transporter receptor subunit TctC
MRAALSSRIRRAAVLAVLAWIGGTLPAGAEIYPTRPIRLVVPFSSGGSVDTVARLLGRHLSENLGQSIVTDVRPGAGTLIGTDIAAKAPPGGYTLLMINSSSASAVSLYKKPPYDLVKDFTPIATIGYTPYVVVVHPKLAVRTLPEFIVFARARPQQLHYASSGNGVGTHLAVELLKSVTGIDLVHVPYTGVAPAVTALVSGEVPVMVVNLVSALPHIRSGDILALALADAARSKLLPDVPTTEQAGLPDFQFNEWYGLVAPAGTPPDIIAQLSAQVARIVGTADFTERLAGLGAEPMIKSPAQFADYLKSEIDSYARIVKAANVQLD